jgi:hypothetical protein
MRADGQSIAVLLRACATHAVQAHTPSEFRTLFHRLAFLVRVREGVALSPKEPAASLVLALAGNDAIVISDEGAHTIKRCAMSAVVAELGGGAALNRRDTLTSCGRTKPLVNAPR